MAVKKKRARRVSKPVNIIPGDDIHPPVQAEPDTMDLKAETLAMQATPIGFVETVLKLPMYPWQRKAIAPLEFAGWGRPIVQISVLAPNEAGKSSRIVAGASMWWVAVHEKGRVAITTKDQKQLNEQVIPAIEREIHKFPGFKSVRSPYYKVETPSGGVIVAYVTDDSSRVEGFHGAPDSPLLEIVDEAKSVAEQIFQGIDRCGFQAILIVSSGGLMMGSFYDSQTKHRDKWHCVRAGLKDCPHISPDKVQRIIDKWGDKHPFTRSCVYGEFMEQDDSVQFIFPHSSVMRCLENPPPHREGLRLGFIDFAEGNAEYVLAVRNGNKTTIDLAFRESDKHAAVSKLIRGMRNANLQSSQVWGDAADKEGCDLLADLGWPINRQNFGAKARNDEFYQSWSAEAWNEVALMVSKGEIIVPRDDVLIAQLTSRAKTFVGRGKIGAEEKYDMRKRGVESPDRADAWCGANSIFDYASLNKGKFSIKSWQENFEIVDQTESLAAIGANWGN